jgi:diaminopimelate epimerase
VSFPYVKGHGTRNDFLVLPDLDGSVHGDLDPAVVAALCDRRAGLGADGVLRVLRGDLDGGPPGRRPQWFMDYRNADGSVSEMCGNGVRVFARYLVESGLVDPKALDGPLEVDTRDGVKDVTFCDDGEISVDMGRPELGGRVQVDVNGTVYNAWAVDVGNPHAVAFVDSLDEIGPLEAPPVYSAADFPQGVNVEFVVRRGPGAVAMRVYERGVGETLSCGTGACAVAVAAAATSAAGGAGMGVGGAAAGVAGAGAAGPRVPTTYAVEVLGGLLTVTWGADGHVHLKGPAVLVAEGTWTGRTPAGR